MLRASPVAAAESAGRQVWNVAKQAWEISNWPEEDLAAVIGINANWVIGTLIAVKVLTLGLAATFRHRRRRASRPPR